MFTIKRRRKEDRTCPREKGTFDESAAVGGKGHKRHKMTKERDKGMNETKESQEREGEKRG